MLTVSEREELSDIVWTSMSAEKHSLEHAIVLLVGRIEELEYNLSNHRHTEVVRF